MKKARTRIPEDVAASVLYASDRTCCVCRERGRAIQIHHIDDDPSNNLLANLATLCLLCHNETQVRGGFGRSLRATEVIQHRNEWVAAVARRRKILTDAAASVGMPPQPDAPYPEAELYSGQDAPERDKMLLALPKMLSASRALAEEGWDTGNTLAMTGATWDVVSVLADLWVRLSCRYPSDHFGGLEARAYFDAQLQARANWHHHIVEPGGAGTGGTIVRTIAALALLREAERMIEDTVAALWSPEDHAGLLRWQEEWRAARR